ncbi:MAG: winged helix-turn-helix domain-containing protein [Trueperaceae bacterium]
MGATAIDHRRILERLEPAGTRRSAVELATLLNESPPRVRRALSDLTRAGLVIALRTGGRITFERRPAHHHRHAKARVPSGAQTDTSSYGANEDGHERRAKDPRAHRRRVF